MPGGGDNSTAFASGAEVVGGPQDIDVYGYGWPVYRGDPIFWADTEGLAKFVEGLEKRGFEVSKLPSNKATAGEKLSKV